MHSTSTAYPAGWRQGMSVLWTIASGSCRSEFITLRFNLSLTSHVFQQQIWPLDACTICFPGTNSFCILPTLPVLRILHISHLAVSFHQSISWYALDSEARHRRDPGRNHSWNHIKSTMFERIHGWSRTHNLINYIWRPQSALSDLAFSDVLFHHFCGKFAKWIKFEKFTCAASVLERVVLCFETN